MSELLALVHPFHILSIGVWPKRNDTEVNRISSVGADSVPTYQPLWMGLASRLPALGCVVVLGEWAHDGFVDWTACGLLSVTL